MTLLSRASRAIAIAFIAMLCASPVLGCSNDPVKCKAECDATWLPQIQVAELSVAQAELEIASIEQQLDAVRAEALQEIDRHALLMAGINAALIVALQKATTPAQIAAALAVALAASVAEGQRFESAMQKLWAKREELLIKLQGAMLKLQQAQITLIQKYRGYNACLEKCLPCPTE